MDQGSHSYIHSLNLDPAFSFQSWHISFVINRIYQVFRSRTYKNNPFVPQQVHESEIKPGDHIYAWRRAYAYSHHGIYIGTKSKLVIHFTPAGESISGSDPRPLASCSTPGCGEQWINESSVFQSCLSCFRENSPVYRYKYGVSPFVVMFKFRGGTCTSADSGPPQEVIDRAKWLLKYGFGKYDVADNNCEDFGLYCKTALLIFDNMSLIGTSSQVNSFQAFLLFTVGVTTTILSHQLIHYIIDRVSSGQGNLWSRLSVENLTGAVVLGVSIFFLDRHANDIGVRPDAVRVEWWEFESFKYQESLDD